MYKKEKSKWHFAVTPIVIGSLVFFSGIAISTDRNNEISALPAMASEVKDINSYSFADDYESLSDPASDTNYQNDYGDFTLSTDSSGRMAATIKFNDGSYYYGGIDSSGLSGNGNLEYYVGDSYSGQYKNGTRNGTGTYIWHNGDKYEGNWDNDSMEGSGKYTWSDGAVLEGKFSDNEFEDGTYTVSNDDGTYVFTIELGDITSADIELDDGTSYEGDVEDGHLNGDAVIEYSNGDSYNGEVSKAKKSGTGKYTWVSGAVYNGKWLNDKINGSGTYKYAKSSQGYKLTGKFKNGVPKGTLKYYKTKSKVYKTVWKNGKCIKVKK